MKRKLPGKPEHEESAELSEEDQKTAARASLLMQHIRHESLPPSEKAYIWTQVEERILQQRRIRLNRLWYSVAASVTLLLLCGLAYLNLNKDAAGAMQKHASTFNPDSEETRLILADRRMISLPKQSSSLAYGENGSLVRIDSATAVDQQISGQEFNTLIVPYGKRSVITLADGTQIWVNSGSKLVYPARFGSGDREVYLEGQAYFAVTHAAEKPFFVHTKHIKVQVFGTEFDVSAYNDDPQASAVLVTGSIELTANAQSLFKSKKTKMEPGMRTVYKPGDASLVTEHVEVEEYVSWKEGYLLLKRAPLAEIVKKLSRYYRADIQLEEPGLGVNTFTGTFDLQENIGSVLDILAAGTSLHYQKKERRFVLGKSSITQ